MTVNGVLRAVPVVACHTAAMSSYQRGFPSGVPGMGNIPGMGKKMNEAELNESLDEQDAVLQSESSFACRPRACT